MSDLDNSSGNSGFWSVVDESLKELSGGRGTFCKVEIGFGFKVYPKRDQVEEGTVTLWPFTMGDKDSTKKAQTLGRQFVVKHGLEKGPFPVFFMKMFADTVIGKEWKKDMETFTFPSSLAYTEIIAPKLRELVSGVGEYYAKVNWVQDPDPKARKRHVERKNEDGSIVLDEEGNVVYDEAPALVAYIDAVYPTYDAMIEAAAEAGYDVDASVPEDEMGMPVPMPDGYDQETWLATMEEIRKEIAKGTKLVKVAKDFDLPVETIKSIIG